MIVFIIMQRFTIFLHASSKRLSKVQFCSFTRLNFYKFSSEPSSKSLSQLRYRLYSVLLDKDSEKGNTSNSSNIIRDNSSKQPRMNIKLNEEEAKVCEILNNVTDSLKKSRPDLNLTLRIAGGWVRDKLLGLECNDLDIALSSLMGYEFAEIVNDYLRENGYPTSGIGKIETNPDRSKHLQTAATKILGLEVDFVNLRNETYQEDSRIPNEIAFGTPEEDALRRDITINALFYNIHTHQVEDLTGKGLSDLESGLIRTPLSAYQTFKDDPLRVIRCIRFASRFHFKIAEEIRETIKNEEIRAALMSKISRERVGIEVDKMIKGPDPPYSFELIHSLDLFNIIFTQPPEELVIGNIEDPIKGVNSSKIIRWLLSTTQNKLDIFPRPAEEIRSLYLASILTPYTSMLVKDRKKEVPAAAYVIRNSLKLPNQDIDTTIKLFAPIESLHNAAHKNEEISLDRPHLGLIIREIGNKWPMALILSVAIELLPELESIKSRNPNENVLRGIQRYNNLIKRVNELGLQECYSLKHIIDGNEIRKLLNIKPGPQVKEYLQSVIGWQLEHPDGTKDECKQYIKEKFGKEDSF
ncbi:11836_t:CDS:10 [Ambispora gerdemannii]|uniref:11836_t:CDS:1 n=1 Tax=Ambispora gerdemannii TaxID=144530 RepID=A0A9N9CHH7_9GLOM|nr:11836_t:CDS:10 [Ambispora gerdemannii]